MPWQVTKLTPHSRRRVSLSDYDWSDLIDDEDRVRMLIDPTGPYAKAAAMAMGRAMDDVIVAAADGTAYTGVAGGTSTVYDTSMTVDVQVGISPAGDTGLNVGKLRAAKQLLDANEAEDGDRYMVINAKQLQNLLAETEITSSDYSAIKSLVHGEVDTFLGFDFKRTERIGTDANSDHKVLYWQKMGMKLALGKEPQVKISERDDKNYATQVFTSMSIGGTRMQEELVGYIECDPT
tara:strand:+ start:3684 stop:4391 length:708 start_codon:yes stop_codon:yes gene_type:complete